MQCTLLIPHLFWPRETAEAVMSGLELPALATILARSRTERLPAITSEGWLCEAHHVERQQDWPIAPLTLALDGGVAGDAYWLRADPVHLRVDRDRLVLVESALFNVTPGEARAFAATLNAHFSSEGIAFHALTPKRWYAKLDRAPHLVTRSTFEAAGRDVNAHLPTGPDALRWHGVFNEAQMLLHAAPENGAREERGEPVVNSVWFWGGGTRQPVRARPYDAVWSDDAIATALAVAGGGETAPLPADASAWLAATASRPKPYDSHLIVTEALMAAAAHQDAESWRAQIAALETRWFRPLLQALRQGRMRRITLVVTGESACRRFEITRSGLMKIWRRAPRWSEYA